MTQIAYANGFRNPPDGAAGLGRIGGKVAQIDDASAISHNPANLTDLSSPSFEGASTLIYSEATFTSPAGQGTTTRQPLKFLPNLFAAWPLPGENCAAGLGVTSPFGQSTVWSKQSAFRHAIPWYSSLVVENVNPTFAFKINDQLSIGVGADLFLSEIDMRQFYAWSGLTGDTSDSDGEARFLAQGFGGGENMGLTWKITPQHRLAVTYRSSVDVEYSGDLHLTNVPAQSKLPPPFRTAASCSQYNTGIEFPAIVTLGYGFEVTDGIRLGMDIEWVQFSTYHTLRTNVGNNDILLASTSTLQNWNDIVTCGLGGDWKFSKDWILRSGYQYLPSPIPDEALSPTLPDADKHLFSVGIGYRRKNWSWDASFAETFAPDRTIAANPTAAFNGTYDLSSHILSISCSYSF
ncbi:MAG: outer membrane protein transport protein [Verrucomicrobiae bacterium]|nr:outer membrane protein transport protein [Verrucomicrobiae bacterium]